jgi:FkbM family methyltransferase
MKPKTNSIHARLGVISKSLIDAVRRVVSLLPYRLRRRLPINVTKHLHFKGSFVAFFQGKQALLLYMEGREYENRIYHYGYDCSVEGQSISLLTKFLHISRPLTFWDVGANTGTYGLLVCALSKGARVVFIEPQKELCEIIQKNLDLNNFSAYVLNMGLSNRVGKAKIYREIGTLPYSVTIDGGSGKARFNTDSTIEEVVVDVSTAENLIRFLNIPKPDIVKLDVEKHELEVLDGFKGQMGSTIFLIEVLSDRIAKRIQEFFPEIDYVYININDKTHSFRFTNQIEKSDFWNYLVLPRIFLEKVGQLKSL